MKIIMIAALLSVSFLQSSCQEGWWKEFPYMGEFTLKHGMMVVSGKDDMQALVTKKEHAQAQAWDFFLAKWDVISNIWERLLFVGRGATSLIAMSKDGAVFIKKPKKKKGQEVVKETKKEGIVTVQLGELYEELLVRIFNEKKIVVRDFVHDEVRDPSKASRSVTLLDMAAANKDELWCLVREVKGDVPRRMKDGSYVTTGKARIRTFVEKWDGSLFKQVGNDIPSTGSGGIAAGRDGSFFVFVHGIVDQSKLFRWDGSAWETVAIPLGTGDRIISLAVLDAHNMWLLLGDGNVHHWNGNTLESRDGALHFKKIYAAPDVVFAQDFDGKIFQWTKGRTPVSFFRRPIEWFKQLFGW